MKRLLLLLLFCPFGLAAQTLILSQTSGNYNWSNTAAWVGGVVPGDGDFVVMKSTGTYTIDQNLGTVGGGGIDWIRQEAGTLTCDNSAARTFTFNSTGTNPIGSGAAGNPGADATAMGFFISKGTFDCEGTAANPITITSANGTSPVYIQHVEGDFTGCTTFTVNVCNGSAGNNTGYITLKYNVIGPVVGTATAKYEGITADFNGGLGGLDLEHSNITGLNRVMIFHNPGAANLITIANNNFSGSTNQYTIYANDTSASGDYTITNNTETGATITNGYFFYAINGALGVTFTGNAELGTASITRGLIFLNTTANAGTTMTGNFCFNPANASLPAADSCLSAPSPYTDTATVFGGNVISGGSFAIKETSGSPTISNNWILAHSDSQAQQGPILVAGITSQANPNTVTISGNIVGVDGNGAGNNVDCLFYTTSASSPNLQQYQVNQNTFFEYAGNVGVYMTEGNNTVTQAIQNSYLTNSIVTNGAYGFVDGNENSTWNSSYYVNSSAVHHNLTYGQSTAGYHHTGTNWSTGFDDGTHHHPSATYYGDIDGINPQHLNASATPAAFDSFCGGPGTVADLFTNLSYRSGIGGTYNSNCSIANMLAWLQFEFTPMNSQLKNAGACGTSFTPCDIGAVPVYPATAQAVM